MRQTTQRTNWWRYRLWLLSGAVAYLLANGSSPHASAAVAGVWALAGVLLLLAWLRRRGAALPGMIRDGIANLWRKRLVAALLALWIVALGVAAMPHAWHVHGLGTGLVLAAAAGTMLLFVRRHPRLVLSLSAIVALTNWLSARCKDSEP